jgi:hypothetical protein
MKEQVATTMPCPKDATAMKPIGRRASAWRCPTCQGVFIDTTAMRQGRTGRRPRLGRTVMNVLVVVAVTRLVRRLRARGREAPQA